MVSFSRIAFAIAAIIGVTAGLVSRDVPLSPFTDLKQLDQDCESFSSACQSSDGSSTSLLTLNNNFQKWAHDCNSTKTDFQASAAFSESDTQSAINYLNSTFEPCLKKSLTCLGSKSSSYKSAGLYGTEQSEVKSFKQCIDDLGSIILSKSPSDKQAAVKAVFAKMDADFNGVAP